MVAQTGVESKAERNGLIQVHNDHRTYVPHGIIAYESRIPFSS